MTITSKPRAVCEGRDGKPCESNWGTQASDDARWMAKGHVKLTGHKVLVITEKRDLYVPDS